jgi:hypothetical protein
VRLRRFPESQQVSSDKSLRRSQVREAPHQSTPASYGARQFDCYVKTAPDPSIIQAYLG